MFAQASVKFENHAHFNFHNLPSSLLTDTKKCPAGLRLRETLIKFLCKQSDAGVEQAKDALNELEKLRARRLMEEAEAIAQDALRRKRRRLAQMRRMCQ